MWKELSNTVQTNVSLSALMYDATYASLRRFGYSFSMNGGKKPIVFAMLFALFLSVIDGALACGWNVGKLSLNGIVPIVISMGTLKLNDRVPGSMTN